MLETPCCVFVFKKADTSSCSEGSTVDLTDPEELLKHIPELSEDFMEPDPCFPESKHPLHAICPGVLRKRFHLSFSPAAFSHTPLPLSL